MGVLALTLTAVVYLPGMLLGYAILRSGMLDGVHWTASAELDGVVDRVWGPLLNIAKDNVPGWLLFPIGLGVILISFKLLDRSSRSWTRTGPPMDAALAQEAVADVPLGLPGALLTLSCRSRDHRDGPAGREGIRRPAGGDAVHHGREHHHVG